MSYLIHKAVELHKVRKARQDFVNQQLYISYFGQKKYDGCNMIVVLHTGQAFSRTGEEALSCESLIKELQRVYGNSGVILAEAWIPGKDFAYISGVFRRKTDQPELHAVVFDMLTAEEYDAGYSPVPYKDRLLRFMCPKNVDAPRVQRAATHFSVATTGYRTWQEWCNHLVGLGGYDGVMLVDSNGTWTAGDTGTGGERIKIKRVLSFDLKVVGYNMATSGKHAGKIGALLLEDANGVCVTVGTGLSDSERSMPGEHFVGRIYEVTAMDYSSNGMLREPRLKGERLDKLDVDALHG